MFSCVIVEKNDAKALYLTYFALRAQLDKLGIDPEFIIVADGGTEVKWQQLPNTRCLRGSFGSPQASRDVGIRAATFNDVLVVESHVVVSDVLALINEHRRLNSAMTFPYRTGEGTELFDVYGVKTNWDGNLWFKYTIYGKQSDLPYRVSQFGHSCFIIRKDWYVDDGGYTDLLKGWGGEEPALCLKFWLMGRSCWLVPSIWHAHFLTPGAHAGRTSDDEFARNMLTVAYMLGGDEQLKICQNVYSSVSFRVSGDLEKERKNICKGEFSGNLKLLRKYMADEGIN